MKLLLDADGHVVVRNGKPVYVHDDGKEVEFDAPGTVATIARLNTEAKTHREGKESEAKRASDLETLLKKFEGLDADEARAAFDKLSKIDQGKLIDSGKVDEVRSAVAKTYEERIGSMTEGHKTELQKMADENAKLTGRLNEEVIGGSFARSQVIAQKLAIPADLVQAKFGQHFKLVDGKMVAYDAAGNQIYSRSRPGEAANFDEALEVLVDNYPHKDHIMKASGASGSGASGSGGGGGGGKGNKGVTREAFDAMSAADRMAHIKSGNPITD